MFRKYIIYYLKLRGITQKQMCYDLDIIYNTFLRKMKQDTFNAKELINIGIYLNIDLNIFKEIF